jgi:hypothetical protein
MGFRLGYVPGAIVGHPARRTWDELTGKWSRVNAETYGLYRTRPAGNVQWFLRNLALPVSAVLHMPKVFGSDQLNTVAQRMTALSTLFRLRMWRLSDALGLLRARSGG